MSKPKKTAKKKIFGIQKKLLITMVPMFVIAFAATIVLIFVSSTKIILSNARHTLLKESESNAKTVTINIMIATGMGDIRDAYREAVDIPVALDFISNSVQEISVMNSGYAFLVNTDDFSIIAHRDDSLTGSIITDYPEGTFLGDVGVQLRAENTNLFEVRDGSESYYAAASYIKRTPWVVVSCVSRDYLLSDLTKLTYLIVGVFAVILLLVITVVSIVLRKTLKPIGTLTSALTTITDGDFSVTIPEKGNDEITVMSRSLNGFVEIMREIIVDIRDISNQLGELSSSSKQISGTLSEAAEGQAESMGDVKVTLDQIANGIQELALHASTLSDVVDETNERGKNAKSNMQLTVDVASRGRSDMETVNQAMESIVLSMKQLADTVGAVGSSTRQINSMVEIISDIAEQTELLSLNAAIEAASAGEAGKGFAVVAEEIRKLADISSSSATKISESISQINTQVTHMMEQTRQSVSYIEANSEKITASCEIFENIYGNVAEADKVLSKIVAEIANVDDVATNIAALSQEQSASTEEILASTELLAESSLQFSSDSKEMARGADHVSDAAFALAEHMRKFKI
ncbi:MAG: methyl-accepting chemotaxis protein [Lachnospiraceae bacterium]|jgi:Methyl-accepting chemotaxis protein|nr:methyl-accepting chemotaxis protein [Lachnospiraceae bacterium]MCI9675193.1 methyl-accepting chemotaxis protein [Lachnospiraceae bacterium]